MKPISELETTLIQRLAAGDRIAFEGIYLVHNAGMVRFATTIVNSRATADGPGTKWLRNNDGAIGHTTANWPLLTGEFAKLGVQHPLLNEQIVLGVIGVVELGSLEVEGHPVLDSALAATGGEVHE